MVDDKRQSKIRLNKNKMVQRRNRQRRVYMPLNQHMSPRVTRFMTTTRSTLAFAQVPKSKPARSGTGVLPAEIFVRVLQHVHDFKTKLRLEATSRSCQTLARLHCWKKVTELNIDCTVQSVSRAFGFIVNGEFCSLKNIPDLLRMYDTRGKWIRKVHLGTGGFLSVGKPSPINLAYTSLKNHKFLESVTDVSVQGSFIKSSHLAEFLSGNTFHYGLTTLNLRWPDKLKEEAGYELWVSIGQMVHLEHLTLTGSGNSVDSETSEYDLVKALRGKPLKTLQLHRMRWISGEGFADALRLCDTISVLSVDFTANFMWEDFAENMDPESFAELTELSCALPPDDFSFAVALQDIPASCPKLRVCRIGGVPVSEISFNMLLEFYRCFLSTETGRKELRLEMTCWSETMVPDFFALRDTIAQFDVKTKCTVDVKQEGGEVSEVVYTVSLGSRCATVVFENVRRHFF